MFGLWLALISPPAIVEGGAPLYARCDRESPVIARLAGGTPVTLGHSLSGEQGRCFHVTAEGRQGYVFAGALTTIEDYERRRLAASDSDLPQILRAEIGRLREESPRHPLLAPALEALDSGRPALALRRIEEDLLARFPEDPNLLALAGLAAYQADDVRKASRYWERSLSLRPNPQLDSLLKRARAELEADAAAERSATQRFVVRYEDKALPSRAAASLLSMLDEELARIDAAIGCPSAEPLTVIVQARESWRAATGAAEWNAGLFDGRIRVPLDEGAPPASLRPTLAHELVHACLARRGIRERWLHEGLAMRWSGERPPQQLLQEAQKLDRLPEWDESRPGRIRLYYAWAWLAVDHLYQTRGEAGVRELLRNPAALPAPAIR